MNYHYEIHKPKTLHAPENAIAQGDVITEESNPDAVVEDILQSVIKQYPKMNILLRYRNGKATALYAIEHWIVK